MITKIIGDKEYQLTIEYTDGDNPRYNSNLGIIVYAHNRYTLGDESLSRHSNSLWEDFLYLINEKYNIVLNESDYGLEENEIESIEDFVKDNIVYLPVYLYDHSGITISTTPFASHWDSGQVGYIYSHKDNIKELSLKEGEDGQTKLKEFLNWEIEVFDKYIKGEFYYFKLESRDIKTIDGNKYYSEWEEIDSCGGLFETTDILEYSSIFTKEEIESCNITY